MTTPSTRRPPPRKWQPPQRRRRSWSVNVLVAARVTFLGAIAITVVWGLSWALDPDPSDGIGFVPADPDSQTEPGEPAPPRSPAPRATPEPTEDPTEDPEELIAAARPPGDTTIQVLDAGGGRSAVDAAAARLRDLGYRVVNTTRSRSQVDRTAVWFSEGQEPEGKALQAREDRIAVVAPNERFDESVNLHVLVGADW